MSNIPLRAGTPNIANHVTGPLHSVVPGRTDHLPISVPEHSYVLPADVVSALGEGNTAAGMRLLNRQFGTSPIRRALGGRTGQMGQTGKPVDIAAAGGEYVVPPEHVATLGNGNLQHGHAVLDAFVKHVRASTVKTLRKMPGPKKD